MIAALRQAIRGLGRSPLFTCTVIATLAIGVGLNTAIFTVVDSVLLRPLGYRDAHRIMAIQTHFYDKGISTPRMGGGDYTDLSRQISGLDATAHYQNYSDGIQLRGTSLYVPVALVSPRFAEILGVQPTAGRLFQAADQDGTDALISYNFARNHFGPDANAIGQGITYNGSLYTVVGILPPGFSFPEKTEVWFERSSQPANANRTAFNQKAVAKRRADVTEAQLDAELAIFSASLRREFVEDRNKSIEAVPLQNQIVGNVRPTLHLLMGAVLVILLIVCANITHLQLVRATRRLRAGAIRTALGASRPALLGYALLETALLAFAGSVGAVLLAGPALRLLIRIAPPDTPRLSEIHLDLRVLAFSFLVALAVMFVTTTLPVWHSWHVQPTTALRSDSARGSESRTSLRLRNSFVVTEIALTLMLSVSAILLCRQLIAQSRQDLGFAPDQLLTLDAHTVLTTPSPVARDDSPAAIAALKQADIDFEQSKLNHLDQMLSTIAHIPGVASVGGISGAPLGFGGTDLSYAIRGRQVFAPGVTLPHADLRPITPGLIETMQIPLLRGRLLTPHDRLGSPGVALVSRELATEIFSGQDPVGQQIMSGYDADSSWLTIVGVVDDIRSESPASPPGPTIYVPVAQHPNPASDMQFVVRTRLPPEGITESIRTSLLSSNPEAAIKITTMRQNLGAVQQAEYFRTWLIASFAGVSILLAGLGLYGVTAYSVTQRRFEFGLRIALGAGRGQVLRSVLGGALSVTGLGVALGVLLSLSATRIVANLVGKLPGFDPLTYLVAGGLVLMLAIGATLFPANAAASTDPMQVLRDE